MSTVWFCSDLHLGHKNIQRFRTEVLSEEDNRKTIYDDWEALVGKNDDVWVLGDWCFDLDHVVEFSRLPARRKYLVRGNHDEFDMRVYSSVFDGVFGLVNYKEFWLSHAPIHPDELRGKRNLHGHVHYSSVMKKFNPVYDVKQEEDTRYFNCCPENLWSKFQYSLVSLDQIRNYYEVIDANSG